MLMRFRDFLCGWRYLTVAGEYRGEAMDLLYRENLSFRHSGTTQDGDVRIHMRARAAKRFLALAEKTGIRCTASDMHGLPVVLAFMRQRPMIPLGCLLAAVWIAYSSHIVWDIHVTGNTKTSDEEIMETLDSLGFGIGTYFPDVDFEKLHTQYAAAQHDIAWLSVYMNEAVAEVQVRELVKDERIKHAGDTYANIVASCTGVVEEIHVFEGQAAVMVGDVVRPGQVLISGVVVKKDGGTRCEYADGEVVCRTVVPISAQVMTERETKNYTGEEKHEKTVKIFKKSINLFGKGGITYASYDKISTMEQVCPFGAVPLPIWIEETVYRETAAVRETISADDAAAEAMAELTGKIKDETADAELVGREVSTTFENGVYRIDCVLTLRKDIGKTVEFTAENTAPPSTQAD